MGEEEPASASCEEWPTGHGYGMDGVGRLNRWDFVSNGGKNSELI